MEPISRQRGFTLIEVMTAVVVFSVGLIGLGFLMTSAVRSNQVGFQHTQASFAAESILDRMRSNLPGVWANNYNGTFSGATSAPSNQCGSGTPCTAAQLAARDTWAWGVLLGNVLPGASGTIACARRAGTPMPNSTEILAVPIYDGNCTITIAWSEQSSTESSGDAGGVAQQFEWVVQP